MDKSIITYSKGIAVNLTHLCRNHCGYCGYRNDEEDLLVPYTTIKSCKKARKNNSREVLIMAGERPDRSNTIRSKLDVWGFESYIDYVYAVCELIFLEGMLPNLNIGYISEREIKVIRRIAPAITVLLESGSQEFLSQKVHKNAPYKTLDSRIEVIRNAGIYKVPVTTGVMVGIGETQKNLRDAFEIIKDIHQELGHIQNVVIQNFVPKPNTQLAALKPPAKAEMLEAVKLAHKILPEEIIITIPLNLNPDFLPFIQAGVRDLGMVDLEYDVLAPDRAWPDLKKVEKQLKAKGWGFQRRLPIFAKYIRDNWYSRKLSQLLDKYRLMIKQAEERNENNSAADKKGKSTAASGKKRKK
ncbi:MAG: 7,8-didemethyl-8-hydroxy-5-deazariboflavin synthase subunit CofG [Candidatus Margulisbacteria bacterium]|nr:7,8-didemethyl-8-hydroxy-5-deazariboflavin synthase subunit CofG [Candidatus Margulisiibacteriota bacterium]